MTSLFSFPGLCWCQSSEAHGAESAWFSPQACPSSWDPSCPTSLWLCCSASSSTWESHPSVASSSLTASCFSSSRPSTTQTCPMSSGYRALWLPSLGWSGGTGCWGRAGDEPSLYPTGKDLAYAFVHGHPDHLLGSAMGSKNFPNHLAGPALHPYPHSAPAPPPAATHLQESGAPVCEWLRPGIGGRGKRGQGQEGRTLELGQEGLIRGGGSQN